VFKAPIKSIYARCHNLIGRLLHQQKGQVLPIALAVLALGTLVIGPFLSHAGTTLKSSGQYQQIIEESYACEAGVEQAIWALTYNGLGEELSEVGSSLNYTLSGAVNSKNSVIGISFVGSEGGDPPGIIAETNLDTLEFSTSAFTPQIIPISDSVYAIVYKDHNNHGILATIQISPDGSIFNTLLDSYVFYAANCYEPNILRIADTIYAIVFRGSANDGFVQTFVISSSGIITPGYRDSLEFDTSACFEPHLILVSGNVYAIVYRGPKNDGLVKTVSISPAGQISESVLDYLEFDPQNGIEPDIFQVSGNIYGVAYRGQKNDGTIRTFSISTAGQIGDAVIDSLLFDSSKGYEPDVIQAGPSVFAIAYRDANKDGYIKTIQIQSNGMINDILIDNLEFSSADGYQPNLVRISNDCFAVAYQGEDSDGFIGTLTILSSGQISDILIDSCEFDNVDAYEPDLIHISGDVYAIAYRGHNSRGYVRTISISRGNGSSGGTGSLNTYLVNSSAGGTAIQATVNILDGIPTVVSWDVSP
jgi:hypothetical protein